MAQDIRKMFKDDDSGNKEKLSKRYHTLTYTDTHAQERRDK